MTTARLGLLVGLFVLSAGCSAGIEAPTITGMVKVDGSEPFMFGPIQACVQGKLEAELCTLDWLSNLGDGDPWPQLKLQISDFHMDVHEVTNVQYEYCVARGVCTEPVLTAGPGLEIDVFYYDNAKKIHDNKPMVNVTAAMAATYCAWVGKRLPTEHEWERVAKGPGTSPRLWPAQDMGTTHAECDTLKLSLPTQDCGWNGGPQEAPVRLTNGSYPIPTSSNAATVTRDYVKEGGGFVFHMFGNVSEWTSTRFHESPTCLAPLPTGCTPAHVCADPAVPSCSPCDGECHVPGQCDDWGTPQNVTNTTVITCEADRAGAESSDKCFYRCVGEAYMSPICAPPVKDKIYSVTDLANQDDPKIYNVVRGGNVDSGRCHEMSSSRSFSRINSAVHDITSGIKQVGFRCALDGPKLPPTAYPARSQDAKF